MKENVLVKNHLIDEKLLEDYRESLISGERSKATIDKYMHDLKAFYGFTMGRPIDKELIISYKQKLSEDYTPVSVNVMLASLNGFLKYAGWGECCVKHIKIQRDAFRMDSKTLTKEEYVRLIKAAGRRNNKRLVMMMETMASTGIRVSELKFITVRAVAEGCAEVNLKGKSRKVLLPRALCSHLKSYIKEKQIIAGSIFITRSGNPVDRSNIWREMNQLYEDAKVDKTKIFPHNLRHLFACIFYKTKHSLTNLADILGHSNINTTRIYTSVSRKEQSRQIESLGLVI